MHKWRVASTARFPIFGSTSAVYSRGPANDFGRLKLQAVQHAMIRLGWCRRHINKQVGCIVRVFGWGVGQELVRADVAQALREVNGLRK